MCVMCVRANYFFCEVFKSGGFAYATERGRREKCVFWCECFCCATFFVFFVLCTFVILPSRVGSKGIHVDAIFSARWIRLSDLTSFQSFCCIYME